MWPPPGSRQGRGSEELTKCSGLLQGIQDSEDVQGAQTPAGPSRAAKGEEEREEEEVEEEEQGERAAAPGVPHPPGEEGEVVEVQHAGSFLGTVVEEHQRSSYLRRVAPGDDAPLPRHPSRWRRVGDSCRSEATTSPSSDLRALPLPARTQSGDESKFSYNIKSP